MKFELAAPIAAREAQAVSHAILSRHPAASIEVEPASGIVRVSGRVDPQQAADALALAGIDARLMPEDAHVSGGSTCCGGCA